MDGPKAGDRRPADGLGVPLFPLGRTGTPRPVNTQAYALGATRFGQA
ncbi:hypothetical protein ACWZEH_28905 [Streptomyces sp. QTS137]